MKIRITSLIAGLSAAPAAALPGGLVPPSDVVTTFEATCGTLGPKFSDSIPARAEEESWDEFGRSENAIGRMWLIAVERSPLILDISDPSLDGESCSVSAISHAPAIEAMLLDHLEQEPVINVSQNQAGSRITFKYTKVWQIAGPNPHKISLVGFSGNPKVRLTIQYQP